MKHIIPQTLFFWLCVVGVVLFVLSSLVELNRQGSAIETLETQVSTLQKSVNFLEALEGVDGE